MAENESIGGIQVDIVGDYSRLGSDIETAAAIASEGGTQIADALNKGAAGADELSQAVTAASVGMGAFEDRIQALVSSGSTLAEALAQMQSQTEPLAAASQAAAEGVQEFGDAAQAGAAELERTRAALQEFFDASEQATEGEHHAAEGLSEWHEKLIQFAEALAITEGLREFGLEALHASDNITRASISLTALTGSGEKAAATIEELEALGIKDGLAMPSLLTAAQRMTALLPAGSNVVELLGQIADGAAVMSTDINAAANSFDRLVSAGTLGARQLTPLGLTLDKVATAMNEVTGASDATAQNVGKMFKAMESTERVEVLSTALGKLSGIAQQAAEHTFGGQWTILANQWQQVMRQVGDALLPVITGLTNLMKVEVLPFLKSVAEGFNALPAPVKELVVGLGLAAAAVVPLTLAFNGLTLAVEAAAGAFAPLIAVVGGPLVAVIGVGLVSALGAAAFGFHDLSVAMAANEKAYADLDAKFQKHMASVVESAHTAAELAAAEEKVKAALDAGAISKEIATKLLGDLAAAEKLVVGTEWNAWASAAGISIRLVTEALTPAQAAAEGMRVKMQTLQDAVTKTRDALVNTTAAYNDHKATTQQVADAYDKWQGATQALKSAQGALLPVVTNVHKATKDWVDITSVALPAAEQQAADHIEATRVSILRQGEAIETLTRQLDAAIAANDVYNTNGRKIVQLQEELATATKKYYDLLGNPPDTAVDFQKSVTASMIAAKNAVIDLLPPMEKVPVGIHSVTEAMRLMGIQVDSSGDSVSKLIKLYEDVAGQKHTLDEEDAAWAKISGSLSKLATSDLPLVLKLYDQHLGQLTKLHASQGEILEAQAAFIGLQIKTAEQSGASATKQIVALENIRLAQQVLRDDTRLLGDLYVGVINDILRGWESLGKSIADNIVDEHNWHDVWINGLKSIAKSILETLVGTAFKALEDSIIKSTGLLDGLTSSFNKLLGTAAGNAAGGAAGAAGSAAGAAGGGANVITNNFAGGGLLAGAGAIGAIASAIEGAFGLAQMSHLISTAGKIEENTRRLDLVAEKWFTKDSWDQQTGIVTTLDMIFDRLGDLWGEIKTGWQNTVTALGSIPQMALGGAVIGDGLRYLHDGEVVIPRAEVPPLLSAGLLKGPSAATYNNSTTASSISGLTFNIFESANPRETARQLADTLRTLSSKFSSYGQ